MITYSEYKIQDSAKPMRFTKTILFETMPAGTTPYLSYICVLGVSILPPFYMIYDWI